MSKIGTSALRLGIDMEQAHQILNAGKFIFAQPHVHAEHHTVRRQHYADLILNIRLCHKNPLAFA